MHNPNKTVVRQGQIYRFSVAGVEYGAFICKVHSQFRGRVIGHPQVPQHKALTAFAVRDALLAWIRTANDDPANAPVSSQ
jgi:hypothetical protein